MRARSFTLAIACAAAASSNARSASADDGLSSDPPPFPTPTVASSSDAPPGSPVPTTWYGGQILLVDLASDLAMIGGAALGNGGGGVLGVAGAVGYVTGAPIIHASHHRGGGVVAASFALRLGIPLLGSMLGAALAPCPAPAQSSSTNPFYFDVSGLDCLDADLEGALIGFGVGMVVAEIVDAAALSYEPVRPPLPDASARAPLVLVQPTVGSVRDTERRTVPTLGVTVSF